MITFYYHPSPNPVKVALMLEETGLPYVVHKVDTFKGEQHTPAFRAINPNAKVPVIVDGDSVVFDSNAILLYLAEKTGRFGGQTGERATVLSWLMFVATGLSPFSGQAVHFLHMAPEKLPYAQNRYLRETERHYQVMDAQLAKQRYLAGADYSIADMAAWGWMNYAGYIFGEKGLSDFPNAKRLFDEISQRPAATRALALKSKITVKTDFDEETQRALFPQNYKANA
jgi:GSH-dependent disulfide-bond oxidoreductase